MQTRKFHIAISYNSTLHSGGDISKKKYSSELYLCDYQPYMKCVVVYVSCSLMVNCHI